MLLYKRSAFSLLLRTYTGSPFLPSLVLALLSTAISVAIETSAGLSRFMDHPYPFQLFAAVVGFGLVFRAQLAYARYWEGRTALASMGGKWTDAVIQIRAFSSTSPEKAHEVAYLHKEVVHLISLMHALTIQHLRGEASSPNDHLNLFDDSRNKGNAPPPLDITKGLNKRRRCLGLFASANNNDDTYLAKVFSLNKVGVIGGVRASEKRLLFEPPSSTGNTRPTACMEALARLIVQAVRNGTIDAPGPIVSRVFQVLSEGHERGVMMARKVAETPFPLPFAQVIEFLVSWCGFWGSLGVALQNVQMF